MNVPFPDKRTAVKFWVGAALLAFGLSHGITGLLANLGWYDWIGAGFDRWYMHPAYQSLCWFANGIGLSILIPMFVRALRAKSHATKTGSSGHPSVD